MQIFLQGKPFHPRTNTMSHTQTPDQLAQTFRIAARLFRVPTNELTKEMFEQVAPAHSFPVGTPLVADDGGCCLLAIYRSHGLVVLCRFEDSYTGSWSPTVLARAATVEDFAHYRVANADRYFAQVAKPN
jgi:hypothetical protein